MKTLLELLVIGGLIAFFVVRWRRGSILGTGPRAQLIRGFVTLAGLVTLGIGGIYLLVQVVLGTGLFVPHSATGILKAAKGSGDYVWTSEAVHEFNAAGRQVREDSRRTIIVDVVHNRYQLLVQHVLPDTTQYQSDGKVTIRNTITRQKNGQPWQLVNNYCGKQPSPPATLLALPSGDLLAAAHPKILSSNSSILGQKAWLMSFEPTPAIIQQLLLIPFLEQATEANEMRWVISPSEAAQIAGGHYQALVGKVWVRKHRPFAVAQVQIELKLANGRSWKLLAALRPTPGATAHPLASMHLPPPPCGG
jgi:hypothetical protein